MLAAAEKSEGVNCCVSHYLKYFLAFLKGRVGQISFPVLLSPSTHMNVSSVCCGMSGLFASKTS